MIDAHITDERGVYLHTAQIDPRGPQPPGAVYAAVPDEVSGHARMWIAGEWQQVPDEDVPPPPQLPAPNIDDLRAAALERINAEYAARASVLAGDYPPEEQQSWPMQVAEAAIVRAEGTEPTPWIDAAAPARGITREALADLIHAQDQAYRAYHGALTGARQALRDAIAAVPDDEHAAATLDAIQWPPDPDPEPDPEP